MSERLKLKKTKPVEMEQLGHKVSLFDPEPVDNRILVAPVTQPKQSEGGIIFPDNIQPDMEPRVGTVIKVGPEVTKYKPGDDIAWCLMAGEFPNINGTPGILGVQEDGTPLRCILIQEEDVTMKFSVKTTPLKKGDKKQ